MSDIPSRLEALERKVAGIKDWKRKYEEEKGKWDKERGELLKSASTLGKLKEILSQFLGLDSLAASPNPTTQILNISHKELVVNLAHGEREINLTTGTVAGRVLFCALSELPKEGFAESELSEALKEHGWNVGHNTLAPTLGGLIRDGNLVRLEGKPARYRLPQRVKLNIVRGSEQDKD